MKKSPFNFIRSRKLSVVLLAVASVLSGGALEAENVLWYKQPAPRWDHGMPIGNGRLGAMIQGGVKNDRIVLNEESVWSRNGENIDKPGGHEHIDAIRELLFAEKYVEADKLISEKLLNKRLPSGSNSYQMLAALHLNFDGSEKAKNYRRELDVERAVSRVQFTLDGVVYTREFFASAVDQAIYVKLSASKPGKISLKASLSRKQLSSPVKVKDKQMHLHQFVGKGVNAHCRIAVVNQGGSVKPEGGGYRIRNANSVLLVITGATDYEGSDPAALTAKQLAAAKGRSYEDALSDHIAEYQSFYNRFSIDLGKSAAADLPTDKRIEATKKGLRDPSLSTLYVQFARYLMISSSRPGTMPANLQGIWADGVKAPWNSDYHVNINMQMNYWPAETFNLADCHEPFFTFIEKLLPSGRKTAQEMYGAGGFALHHTTDAWHFTTGFGQPRYGMWPVAGGWVGSHFWEHYLYGRDQTFLGERAYPFMKEAAEFYLDFLVEHPKTGKLVSGPSISPENMFLTAEGKKAAVCMGPAMDHQIIHENFTACIEASQILGIDSDFRAKLEAALSKLAPVEIGEDGRILEWTSGVTEADPGHRHISHLFGLHPGRQYSYQDTPEVMEAAKKVLAHRLKSGGGHTGWSRAWIINFYARLADGDAAHSHIEKLFAKSTFPSMLDKHPPFQIDGNFGGAAGIIEMLMQSHAGEIELLPALPKAWPSGSVKGLRARGGFEIDFAWEDGVVTQSVIRRNQGLPAAEVNVRVNGVVRTVTAK